MDDLQKWIVWNKSRRQSTTAALSTQSPILRPSIRSTIAIPTRGPHGGVGGSGVTNKHYINAGNTFPANGNYVNTEAQKQLDRSPREDIMSIIRRYNKDIDESDLELLTDIILGGDRGEETDNPVLSRPLSPGELEKFTALSNVSIPPSILKTMVPASYLRDHKTKRAASGECCRLVRSMKL